MTRTTSTISFGPRFVPASAPVTFWLLVVVACAWLVETIFGPSDPLAPLIFSSQAWTVRPWSLLTYPLVHPGWSPFALLLTSYVVWWAGSDLERWWGSRVQAGLLAVTTVLTALLLVLGTALSGLHSHDAGLLTPLTALLSVWGLRYWQARIWLLIIPASGMVLFWLGLVEQWWRFGPLLGLFAVAGGVGLPAAYYRWGHHWHNALARLRRPRLKIIDGQ